MSMSVVIWAACSLSLPNDLPEPDKWQSPEADLSGYEYNAEAWLVTAGSLEGSQAPPEVKSLNAKASEGFFVAIEPIGADEEGYAFLGAVASAIAVKCGGAVIESPAGLVQLDAQGEEIRSD